MGYLFLNGKRNDLLPLEIASLHCLSSDFKEITGFYLLLSIFTGDIMNNLLPSVFLVRDHL